MLDISLNYGVTDELLRRTLSLLPDLTELRIVGNRSVTNWFVYAWFQGGATDPDALVGSRRKFAPLTLFCDGTRIASKQYKAKKGFPWKLVPEEGAQDPSLWFSRMQKGMG